MVLFFCFEYNHIHKSGLFLNIQPDVSIRYMVTNVWFRDKTSYLAM